MLIYLLGTPNLVFHPNAQHTNFHFYAIQTKIKAVQLLEVQFCLKEHTVD